MCIVSEIARVYSLILIVIIDLAILVLVLLVIRWALFSLVIVDRQHVNNVVLIQTIRQKDFHVWTSVMNY